MVANENTGEPSAVTYSSRLGYACDDCSVGADGVDAGGLGLPIGFPVNFYGTTYNNVFVNSNGSISFGGGSDNYDEPLNDVLDGRPGVVAYAIDLYNGDLAYSDSAWGTGRQPDFFYWGRTTFDGHDAFAATWMSMRGCCSDDTDASTPRDTFQILLVNEGEGNGDVDIVINYGQIDAINQGYSTDGESNLVAAGLGTVDSDTGAVTYASLVDDDGVLYNGLTTTDTSDTGTHPVSQAHLNSEIPGRFQFEMRDGALPQTATAPGAVTNLAATVSDPTTASLTWDPPTNLGGSPILSYDVRYRLAGSSDAWTTDSVGTTADSLTIEEGKGYEYQVAAVNGVGAGPWSALATFGVTPAPGGSPAPAPQPLTRLAGDDRYQTAATISQQEYPDPASAKAVVLARSDDYPDALVGAPLAAANDGPLLFTHGAALPTATVAELTRVLPAGRTVYLLGNTDAIPASVANQVNGMGYHVVRFGGANRFETAVAVAHALGDPSTVLLATGRNFADALASGPAAASVHGAVLLTDGDRMPAATAAYLAAHPGTVYAIGGPAAAADPHAIVVSGSDRYATAAAAATTFFDDPQNLGVASGSTFADGLPAGAFLAHTGGPLLLTEQSNLPTATGDFLAGVRGSVLASNTFGGTATISEQVQNQIASALAAS
jgi:putative cell wall-binding protein